ncbi:hypothetical protein ACVXG8_20085 [Escherichia coli]
MVQKEAKTDTTRLNNGGVLEVQDGGEAKHVVATIRRRINCFHDFRNTYRRNQQLW